MSAMLQVSADRLQQLRSDARLERDTILERRVRGGEDPAIAVEEAPEVDDFVVLALRDELLEDSGRLAEFGLARLAARAGGPEAEAHRRNADRVEFELLRIIAAAVPELTVAVWRAGEHLTTE
ncbi:hypothetical protein EDF60_2753 [Leucobacter luti]|uniref:hypothetical protein n=2 Tax=Leucobacter luti TaxID=340320 RepID=UPI00105226BB|nr:hypothetical protein [Leucobacter luti]MCW2289876.1 hypothetical protein [Leucobacter luti]TCK36045.1 hypothetical protein EDF60_2753 [Leucobacter luti]